MDRDDVKTILIFFVVCTVFGLTAVIVMKEFTKRYEACLNITHDAQHCYLQVR